MTLITDNLSEDNKTIIKVTGQLDIFNAPELEQKLIAAIKDRKKTVILDFTELDYISSAAIRVIIMCSKELSADNRKIQCRLSRNSKVRGIFSLAGLYSVLDIEEV